MRPTSQRPIPPSPSPHPRGFALISCISIMALIVMICLGMLALSGSEVKKAKHTTSELEARANARMALSIALSELQKSLGPDQRISVSSSVLDATPDTPAIDGLAHNNMLMVYDSWDTHLQGKKYLRDKDGEPTSSSITISDTYKAGRHQGLFRRHLISHTDETALQNMQAAVDSSVLKMTGDNSVTLVSPVDKNDADYDTSNNLTAGLIPINNNKGCIA